MSIDCSAAKIASPVAVDSDSFSPSTARLIGSRSTVGDTSTAAVPANDTSPRLTPGVSWSANDFAAACAAASRLGSTSVACIDSDTSITSTTVARLRGTRASACGPGQRDREQRPARGSARPPGRAGTSPGRFGAIRSSSSRLVNAHRVAAAPAQQQHVAGGERRHHERAAAATTGVAKTSSPPPPDQARLRASANRTMSATQSESVRSVRCAAPQRRSAAATRSRCAAAAAANSRHSSGVVTHLALAAGLGVGQHDGADVGQLQLARVEHLDGQQLVPRRQRPQRRAPRSGSPRKSEITTASPRRRGGRRSCSTAAARSPRVPLGRARRLRDPAEQPARVREPAAGGDAAPSARPVATSAPIRLPPPRGQVGDGGQRGDRRGRASRTTAVPKSRLGDRSITTQVSSSRSATVWRTCGCGGAGGDRPVHPAHVVAGLVGPRLTRLAARAGHEPEVVALQQPVEPAADGQLQRAQRRLHPPVAERRRRGRRAAPRSAPPAGLDVPLLAPGAASRRALSSPRRAAAGWRGRLRPGGDLRQRHGGEHPGDDVVHRHPVGHRVVGEHQPVPQHVRRDVQHVLRAARSRGRGPAPARGRRPRCPSVARGEAP